MPANLAIGKIAAYIVPFPHLPLPDLVSIPKRPSMFLRRIYLFALMTASLCTMSGIAAAESSFRIMTYNIRYDNPADSLDNWKYRKEFIFSTIRIWRVEIFGIQEGLANQVSDLAAAFPRFKRCGVGRDDGKKAGEFSAIFFDSSRFQLETDSTFWLSLTPNMPSKGWDAALNRIVTWARLKDKTSGKEFYVFNTHFDHQGVTAREESARLLLREIRRIATDKPVILTGDFNSSDTETPYSILTAGSGDSGQHLVDAMKISQMGHHGPLKTYAGFGVHKGIIGERIDFVFVSNNVQVLNHATLSDFMSNEHFPSDHLPVLADILLP
jgi:endonuclease/exonuclease/phosphatase family metal-dependent hydrolase